MLAVYDTIETEVIGDAMYINDVETLSNSTWEINMTWQKAIHKNYEYEKILLL